MEAFHAIDSDALVRPDNFTGTCESHWPSGKLRCRGRFVDGKRVGQHVCFWEDGTIAEICWFDANGCPRGTILSFYPDGDKQSEQVWDDPERRPGTLAEYNFDSNGDVFLRARYCEREQVEYWERPKEDGEEDIEIDAIVADGIKELTEKLEGRDDEVDDDYDDVNDRQSAT